MRKLQIGRCESCEKEFGYNLIHNGFNNSVYAYCDCCGMTADLSVYDKRMPKLDGCEPFQEICRKMEPYIQPCQCGGAFKKGAAPRCPHCKRPLSAKNAANYFENNAAGTKAGWRWQKSWGGLYSIVIENRVVSNNFRNVV